MMTPNETFFSGGLEPPATVVSVRFRIYFMFFVIIDDSIVQRNDY